MMEMAELTKFTREKEMKDGKNHDRKTFGLPLPRTTRRATQGAHAVHGPVLSRTIRTEHCCTHRTSQEPRRCS